MFQVDLAIIGGGPAALVAAIEAKKNGIDKMVILEKEESLGGLLNQCIHTGYGTSIFNEEMTGPEFSEMLINKIHENNIEYKLNTFVMNIDQNKVITAVNIEGIIKIKAKSIIIAVGAKERPRGSMNILGSKYAGIFTAGTAQKLVNIHGILPGKQVVILGSRDLGMVMARRMILEGAEIKAILEFRPYIGGVDKIFNECIKAFDIPVKFNHTIVELRGKERLEGVVVAKVGPDKRYIEGTEEFIPCDTLLLSVGLEPEYELIENMKVDINESTMSAIVSDRFETSRDGVFICGNSLHIHDYIDTITEEAVIAANYSAKYLNNEFVKEKIIDIDVDGSIRYTIPNRIQLPLIKGTEFINIKYKADKVNTNVKIHVSINGKVIFTEEKEYITPSEVEEIKIPYKLIENLNCERMKLCIESQEQHIEEKYDSMDMMCQGCTLGCNINVEKDEKNNIVVKGNLCKKGEEYGKKEFVKEERTIIYKVKVNNGDFKNVPVKTNQKVPREIVKNIMDILKKVEIEAPFEVGEVVIQNIADSGIDVVSTRKINKN